MTSIKRKNRNDGSVRNDFSRLSKLVGGHAHDPL